MALNTSYPDHPLTERERELREWLITQPGGAEWWYVIKSGFRLSYNLGLRDASKEYANVWDEGFDRGHSVGYNDALDPDAPSFQRNNPYRTEKR